MKIDGRAIEAVKAWGGRDYVDSYLVTADTNPNELDEATRIRVRIIPEADWRRIAAFVRCHQDCVATDGFVAKKIRPPKKREPK